MAKLTDMTTGSISKHLLAFAAPLLLGNIVQQFYNMVDSIIVGNYVGQNALAAVGTCGSMGFLFFSLSSGLAIGIGIIVSQYFGAKDYQNVRTTIGSSLYVLSISAFIVTLIGVFLSPALLRLLQCPNTIFKDAVTYMRVTSLGIVFIALYNGVAAILRALGDSKSPLYFLIISSIVNIALDLLFVLVLNWEVFGVAFATVISQAISAIASFMYAYKKVDFFRLTPQELKPKKKIIANSFKLGVPLSLQNSLIAVSCMVLQGVVNTFGESVIAAYTICMKVEQLVQQPYSSLGAAVTSFSGQNMGAGDIARVKKGMHRGTLFALIFSLTMLPVAYIFGENVIGFFIDGSANPETIKIGAMALKITSLFYFPLGMIYVPRAVLNGCGDTNFSMINGISEVACRVIFSQILCRIASITIFGITFPISYWGIWITTGLTWFFTGIVCLIRYKFGKWKTKGIIAR